MNAEIGIDDEGRAYLHIRPTTETEAALLRYMQSFLPMTEYHDGCGTMRVHGERLPGSGKATP